MTVKLTALRTLTGTYGTVHEGGTFEVSEEDAESLESRGLAERHREPVAVKMSAALPENKMLRPFMNKRR